MRHTPAAAMPFLVVRDLFEQRTYTEHAGYWRSNAEGVDVLTHTEWAGALNALAGDSEDKLAAVADDLEKRGDAALALQIADLGLTSHPSSKPLSASRAHVLSALRQLSAQMNPFRFIVYSEQAASPSAPVAPSHKPAARRCSPASYALTTFSCVPR